MLYGTGAMDVRKARIAAESLDRLFFHQSDVRQALVNILILSVVQIGFCGATLACSQANRLPARLQPVMTVSKDNVRRLSHIRFISSAPNLGTSAFARPSIKGSTTQAAGFQFGMQPQSASSVARSRLLAGNGIEVTSNSRTHT